ncbi:glycogen synthase GlgA [Sphingomonas bacterium]|uniref:glycogen synthase GlgA n=1 Tax=Sphingomonas bacterium TaxID=1895847 RepID=UPI0020C72B88|nr:glycogen synthase GlgA [Sphingomonas bacterium]
MIRPAPLKVLSVASEAFPLVKTGGLADVVGALPAAVAPHGVAMTVLVPGYPAVLGRIGPVHEVYRWPDLLGADTRLLATTAEGFDLLVLDAPALFDRPGTPYIDADGRDWPDNGLRFAAFSRAAAQVAAGAVRGLAFKVLHAHDWQSAMAAAYLRYSGRRRVPASIVTIHNIAFQGRFEPELFPDLRLPAKAWSIDGVEYYGGVGFLKAGLLAADAITTVSPSYADEIRTADYGMGLQGLIDGRRDRLRGIVNGIDPAVWSPVSDPALPQRYSADTLDLRPANKRALEAEFGLTPGDGPVFVVVSRLAWQKGMDLLIDCLDELVACGGRLALLGSGEVALERGFLDAAARHPGRIGIRIGYDEPRSHLMQGGGDAILIPSRFEPCGLTQLYGLAYGCVPVVARTGGLADTVIDANDAALAAGVPTGIQFDLASPGGLSRAIRRAIDLYAQAGVWRRMQRAGMTADFSWARSGQSYARLYRELT